MTAIWRVALPITLLSCFHLLTTPLQLVLWQIGITLPLSELHSVYKSSWKSKLFSDYSFRPSPSCMIWLWKLQETAEQNRISRLILERYIYVCVSSTWVCLFTYVNIYMSCLLSFMYACLQRQRKTANGVGVDFHQPWPCSKLCPCFLPAACALCCHRLLLRACCSWLLVGCRGCSHLSSCHHCLARPWMCCTVQCSLGVRWSLPRDVLLCQVDAQTQSGADVGLYSAPVLSAMGQEGVSTSPQAVPLILIGPWDPHPHGTPLAHNECINNFPPFLLYFHAHSEYEQGNSRQK